MIGSGQLARDSSWRKLQRGEQRSPSTVKCVLVGIPAEVKDSEAQVALPPEGVRELTVHGLARRYNVQKGKMVDPVVAAALEVRRTVR